jgi:hypothetical protein
MSERVTRSLKGIVTAALSLLIVAGPVTAALADGGPDRVLPKGQQAPAQRPGFGDLIGAPKGDPAGTAQRPGFGDLIGATDHPAATIPRPGFGDRIQPARPGFGDLIRYPKPASQPAPVGVSRPVGEPVGGGSSTPLVALAAALTALLAAAGAWYEVSRRKRVRVA